jgi:hypothetical protein
MVYFNAKNIHLGKFLECLGMSYGHLENIQEILFILWRLSICILWLLGTSIFPFRNFVPRKIWQTW